jgi:hypothetical protein
MTNNLQKISIFFLFISGITCLNFINIKNNDSFQGKPPPEYFRINSIRTDKNKNLIVTVSSPAKISTDIALVGTEGNILYTKKFHLKRGINQVKFNNKNLPKGNYSIKIMSRDFPVMNNVIP